MEVFESGVAVASFPILERPGSLAEEANKTRLVESDTLREEAHSIYLLPRCVKRHYFSDLRVFRGVPGVYEGRNRIIHIQLLFVRFQVVERVAVQAAEDFHCIVNIAAIRPEIDQVDQKEQGELSNEEDGVLHKIRHLVAPLEESILLQLEMCDHF